VKGIRVIAGLTCREALRRKIPLAALLLGMGFLALYATGLYFSLEESSNPLSRNLILRRQIFNAMLVLGLYAVNWLSVFMTILISVDTLAGEIASGTIQAVASKPIRRWQIVLGKYAGFCGMLTLYLAIMAGGVVFEVWLYSHQTPPHLFRALALMWLECMLLLAVSFRVGTSLSTLATGVLVFSLHGLAFLGGWVEEIGSFAGSKTAVNVGIIASLIMPSESMWRRAASDLQGAIIGGVGRTPFSVGSTPSIWMIAYAGLYLCIALALAVRRFSRRDL
jgi:Cu-processing system permease protein